MRYSLTSALGYLALMTAWIFGVADAGWDVPEALVAVVLFTSQIAVGLLIGRWWALLLPGAALLISIPAGYSDAYPGAEIPIWFGVMVGALVALPLVAVGVIATRLRDKHVRRTRSRRAQVTTR